MNLSKIAFVALGVLLSLAPSAYAKSQEEVIQDAMKFTVLITNEGFTGRGGRGSGILLDEQTVLTCFHLLKESSPFEDEFFIYTYPLGHIVKARPAFINKSKDLALLILDTPVKLKVKPIFQPNVTVGQRVYAIGNTLGSMQWDIISGIISGQERHFILSDMRVNTGNSGGPWINDKGEVIGVTDWIVLPGEGGPGISAAVSGKVLYDSFYSYLHPETRIKKVTVKK